MDFIGLVRDQTWVRVALAQGIPVLSLSILYTMRE
jgi:hypothetical protein